MSVTFGVKGLDEPDMNLANVNARDLLRLLGLEAPDGSLDGEVKARDLRARIETARAVPDRGRLGYVDVGKRGAMVWDHGRAPGRLAEYLDELTKLCDVAGELGTIWWY